MWWYVLFRFEIKEKEPQVCISQGYNSLATYKERFCCQYRPMEFVLSIEKDICSDNTVGMTSCQGSKYPMVIVYWILRKIAIKKNRVREAANRL